MWRFVIYLFLRFNFWHGRAGRSFPDTVWGTLLEYDASPRTPTNFGNYHHMFELFQWTYQPFLGSMLQKFTRTAYFSKAPNLMKFYFCLSIPNPGCCEVGKKNERKQKHHWPCDLFKAPHWPKILKKNYRCPRFTFITQYHHNKKHIMFLKGTVHSN